MNITSKPLAATLIALFFGGIFFSSALGWWQTETTRQAAVFTTGEFSGQANPADIRGSYSFGDVEKNFNLPAPVLARAFGVDTPKPTAFQVKTLEEMYAGSGVEVGTASVRLFVAFYLGLPFDLSADIYLPESAAALLQDRNLGPEQVSYLAGHTVPNPAPASPEEEEEPAPAVDQSLPASTITAPPAEPTSVATQHAPVYSSDRQVKGKTTFAELLEWGLTKEAIEVVLGVPMPATSGVKVKDFCSQEGLSFDTVRPALQAEIDKLP